MDRPDLAALAAETKEVQARIDALKGSLNDAMQAALGEETDTEVSPGSGDAFEVFEAAMKKASDAGFAIGQIVAHLAEQQGYRDFADAGVVTV